MKERRPRDSTYYINDIPPQLPQFKQSLSLFFLYVCFCSMSSFKMPSFLRRRTLIQQRIIVNMGFLQGLGYFLIALLFIGSGYSKVVEPEGIAAGIKETQFFALATRNGIPLGEGNNLPLFVTGLGAALIVASLCFIFGIYRRLAALFLAFCVLNFTVFIHLNLADPSATDMNNQAHIFKNLAVIGGLLVIAGTPSHSGTKKIKSKKD